MVRAVPEGETLPTGELPSPITLLRPHGLPIGILVCGASARSQRLIRRIYGGVLEEHPDIAGGDLPTVLIREGHHPPRFSVDRPNARISISGPIVTVAQLKISTRYLTASTALRCTSALVPVHGTLVAFEDRALLICGSSGAGKSRLAEDLARQGGTCIVDDWTLYDSASRKSLPESELRTLMRGSDSPPTSPTWKIIESFEGDPRSPQSRYVRDNSDARTARDESARVTHLLILEEPDSPTIELKQESHAGSLLQHMKPQFSDEALDILRAPETGTLVDRMNKFGQAVHSMRLTGHRASPEQYRAALALISRWLKTSCQ
jgi:hypothetical protein